MEGRVSNPPESRRHIPHCRGWTRFAAEDRPHLFQTLFSGGAGGLETRPYKKTIPRKPVKNYNGDRLQDGRRDGINPSPTGPGKAFSRRVRGLSPPENPMTNDNGRRVQDRHRNEKNQSPTAKTIAFRRWPGLRCAQAANGSGVPSSPGSHTSARSGPR